MTAPTATIRPPRAAKLPDGPAESRDQPSSITELQDAIDALREKIVDLNREIGEYNSGREEYQHRRDELRQEMNDVSQRIAEIENQRRELMNIENKVQSQSRSLRTKVEALQKSMTFRTVEEVEARIEEIEYKRLTADLGLKEDKILQQEVDKLRKKIPEIKEYQTLEAQLQQQSGTTTSSPRSPSSDIVEQRNAFKDHLRVLRDTRDSLRMKLSELDAARAAAFAPLRDLFAQRDVHKAELAELTAKLSELLTEQQQKRAEQYAEQSRKRQEKMELDRFTRQMTSLEKDKQAVQNSITDAQKLDYNPRTALALQVKEYLEDEINKYDRSIRGADSSTDANTPQVDIPDKVEVGGATYVVRQKKVEPMPVMPRKSKKQKATIVSSYLNHSLASLKDIQTLGVTVPKTVDEARDVTLKEVTAILDEQSALASQSDAVRAAKVRELERRLEALATKEQQLLERAPLGWKR